MRRRTALLLLLAAAATLPLRADTVRLKNGRAYEGVIAERTAQGVRVQLAFGHIVIPADQVTAIEQAPSALATYLERRAALDAREDATASDWFELARWAKRHDFASASREAALLAAELDPKLAGLDALLRPLGMVYEEALGRWIPFAESMARRGLVPWHGEWVTVAEQRERREEERREFERREAARAQEAANRRLADVDASMRRTEERLARREELQLRAAELAASYPVVYGPVMTFPGFWMPPVVVVVNPPGQPAPGQRPPAQTTPSRNTYGRLQSRQPGSLLPPYGDPIVAPELYNRSVPGTSATSSGS